MKNLLLIICFTFLTCCVKYENNFSQIKFEFYSSWNFPVFYNLDVQNNKLEVSYYQYQMDDTLNVFCQKNFKLDKTAANKFYSKILALNYDTSKIIGKDYLDGSGFRFLKILKNDTISIICKNPRRNNRIFTKEYELLEALIDLIDETNIDYIGDSLYRTIYYKYSGKIRFKQISESPLEYRFYGAITEESLANDSLLFLNFFNELPKDEPVLIDMTFSSDYFSSLLKADNVYLYGNYEISKCYDEYKKLQKEIDTYGNDTIWKRENRKKYRDCKFNKAMYQLAWLKNKHKNHFLTRQEALKNIVNMR